MYIYQMKKYEERKKTGWNVCFQAFMRFGRPTAAIKVPRVKFLIVYWRLWRKFKTTLVVILPRGADREHVNKCDYRAQHG